MRPAGAGTRKARACFPPPAAGRRRSREASRAPVHCAAGSAIVVCAAIVGLPPLCTVNAPSTAMVRAPGQRVECKQSGQSAAELFCADSDEAKLAVSWILAVVEKRHEELERRLAQGLLARPGLADGS